MAKQTVVSGPRGAEARASMAGKVIPQKAPTDLPKDVVPAMEGEVVFISSMPRLRICLWVDWEKSEYNMYGRKVPQRKDVQFDGGVFRSSDEKVIAHMRKASGFDREFFEQGEILRIAEEAKLNTALASADDPAVAAALRTKLGMKEHALPARAVEEDAAEA